MTGYHSWKNNVCTRCKTSRESTQWGYAYRGGHATIKGRRLLVGVRTYAREHDVICAPEGDS